MNNLYLVNFTNMSDFLHEVFYLGENLINIINISAQKTLEGEISGLVGMSLPKIHTLWSSIPIGVGF